MSSHPASEPSTQRQQRVGAAVAIVVPLLIALLLTAVGLSRTEGTLTYTLDDPYIHLALSEQIRSGHYGLTAGEPAAPASSIVWPVLLAPTAGTPLHTVTPLAINLLALAATAGLLYRLVYQASTPGSPYAAAGLVTLLLVLTNGIGVALTGMEHSLQVLGSVIIASGLIGLSRHRDPPWWFWMALTVLPLVRYETLAITVPAGVLALVWGKRRPALTAFGLSIGALAAFSLWLRSLGLEWLPSSVLAKGGEAGSDNAYDPIGLISNALDRTASRPLPFFLLLATAALAVRARRGQVGSVPEIQLLASLLATLSLQLLFGPVGWFERYEVWVNLYAIVILWWVVRKPAARFLRRSPAIAVTAGILALLLLSGGVYLRAAILSPRAMEEIHAQSRQLGRFINEVDEPVAVNDLGLASYDTDQRILDLWGLGSEPARVARFQAEPGWLDELVTDEEVAIIVVFDHWFEDDLPEDWIHVGWIAVEGETVVLSGQSQSVYGVDAGAAQRAEEALDFLRRDSPASTRILIG